MWSKNHKRKSSINEDKISDHTYRFRDSVQYPTNVRNLVCCGQRPKSGTRRSTNLGVGLHHISNKNAILPIIARGIHAWAKAAAMFTAMAALSAHRSRSKEKV